MTRQTADVNTNIPVLQSRPSWSAVTPIHHLQPSHSPLLHLGTKMHLLQFAISNSQGLMFLHYQYSHSEYLTVAQNLKLYHTLLQNTQLCITSSTAHSLANPTSCPLQFNKSLLTCILGSHERLPAPFPVSGGCVHCHCNPLFITSFLILLPYQSFPCIRPANTNVLAETIYLHSWVQQCMKSAVQCSAGKVGSTSRWRPTLSIMQLDKP